MNPLPLPLPLPVVVLISGSGSNLQALIDGAAEGRLPIDLRAVISNEPGAYGLKRAAAAGIPGQVLNHRGFPGRGAFDQALMALIDACQPELVVLAGFMRILTPAFVAHYRGRLLNIHPSLLPRHRGLHTHARALQAGDREHGASVHFVTDELDGGPLVLQVRVAVQPDDDPDTLAARVLRQEHRIYPQAVRWFAEGRLRLTGRGTVVLDGGVLAAPVLWTADLPEQD
jgi:phosphoribosylglycinamide formyltransferase-1